MYYWSRFANTRGRFDITNKHHTYLVLQLWTITVGVLYRFHLSGLCYSEVFVAHYYTKAMSIYLMLSCECTITFKYVIYVWLKFNRQKILECRIHPLPFSLAWPKTNLIGLKSLIHNVAEDVTRRRTVGTLFKIKN